VIHVNDFYCTRLDPATNRLLHIVLCPTRTIAISEMFLSELREKHLVNDAIFLINGAP
jgi:transposase-like protein